MLMSAMADLVFSRLIAAAASSCACVGSGFMAGKRSTSLMFHLLVRNIVSRSMPRPQPAVGGRACSSATQKSSSQPCILKRNRQGLGLWQRQR